MRKILSLLIVALLVISVSTVVFAASEEPVITLQPQSPNYPQYSVAIYTVKATGTNLSATWYMEWLGKTYTISNIGGAMQDWEPYAGEAYGARQLDDNTFAFIFEGIEYDLDGAYIWCVIEDGHYDVTSQKVRVSVGNENSPPVIVDVPSQVTVEQGAEAMIRCVAQSPDGSQLDFLWYETDTGRMEDMRAANRGEETSDYMFCDTSMIGTRYYLCRVGTDKGGLAYTSIVAVTVTEKTNVPEPPSIQTVAIPEAQVGKEYEVDIVCSDPEATIVLYYSPGGANDFEKIGLKLEKNGRISGIPNTAGEFSFSVCAAGAGGEDYMTYTLIVKAAPTEPTMAPTTEPTVAPTTEPTAESTAPTDTTGAEAETTADTAPPTETEDDPLKAHDTEEQEEDSNIELPWWSLLLIGLAGAGAGVAVAVILIRKNQTTK